MAGFVVLAQAGEGGTSWAAVVLAFGPLLGVVVGAVGAYVVQSLSWKRDEILKVRLMITDTRTLIWNPAGYPELSNHLAKLRVRLTGLGIPQGPIEIMRDAAMECIGNLQPFDDPHVAVEDAYGVEKPLTDRLDEAMEELDRLVLRQRKPALLRVLYL